MENLCPVALPPPLSVYVRGRKTAGYSLLLLSALFLLPPTAKARGQGRGRVSSVALTD